MNENSDWPERFNAAFRTVAETTQRRVWRDWRRRVMAVSELLCAAAGEIAAESGRDVSEVRENLDVARRSHDDMLRRVLIVAERR